MQISVIADELTASGWRLAGASVQVPDRDDAQRAFERALEEAQLLLVTAEVAEWLDPAGLARALVGTDPLVLVIDDLRGRVEPPDIEREVRRGLGVEA
ncbi:MAG TPA: V-type ATP synthase subunit F [Steroidobacteraceae bacterium]|nr:V-type ATP synthase subunit F [Steroidobacteraceae bacterium]